MTEADLSKLWNVVPVGEANALPASNLETSRYVRSVNRSAPAELDGGCGPHLSIIARHAEAEKYDSTIECGKNDALRGHAHLRA